MEKVKGSSSTSKAATVTAGTTTTTTPSTATAASNVPSSSGSTAAVVVPQQAASNVSAAAAAAAAATATATTTATTSVAPTPPTSISRTKLDRELNKKLHKIANILINDPESSEFRKPVYYKALGLEDYKKIIKKPMDLNTVRRNLTKNLYEYLEEVLDEFQLVWNNCKLYNEQKSMIYLTAVKLETSFHEMCRESFPNTPLPNNKIPDKQLLLAAINEKKLSKQKSQNAAAAAAGTTGSAGSGEGKSSVKADKGEGSSVGGNGSNNQEGNSGVLSALAIQQRKEAAENFPFRHTKGGLKRKAGIELTKQVPYLKFANDKLKFDQLVQTTKHVSKLSTIRQKQTIQIIEEFQPNIVQNDIRGVKTVDFHQVSEYTYEVIQSFFSMLKSSNNGSGIDDVLDLSEEDSCEPELQQNQTQQLPQLQQAQQPQQQQQQVKSQSQQQQPQQPPQEQKLLEKQKEQQPKQSMKKQKEKVAAQA